MTGEQVAYRDHGVVSNNGDVIGLYRRKFHGDTPLKVMQFPYIEEAIMTSWTVPRSFN